MQNQQLPETVLGQRVRQLRQAKGWSQYELADRMTEAGMSWQQTTAAKTESGDRPVRVNEAWVLAAVLGTTLEQLTRSAQSAVMNEMFAAQQEYNRADTRLREAEREAEAARAARAAALEASSAATERYNELVEREREGGDDVQHQETS